MQNASSSNAQSAGAPVTAAAEVPGKTQTAHHSIHRQRRTADRHRTITVTVRNVTVTAQAEGAGAWQEQGGENTE